MQTPAQGNDDLINDPDRDRNPDPITGAPGAHPIGTGVGAAGGGAAGAAIGAAIGAGATGPASPIGVVVGAVVGAVAGGLAGKGAAEAVNPTAEDEYWRTNYASRPYYESGYTYDEDYRPAYEYGWRSRSENKGRKFGEIESNLERGWEKTKSRSRLGWEKARHATRDAFERSDRGPNDLGGAIGEPQAYPGHTSPASPSDDLEGFAVACRTRYAGRDFDDVESDLHRDWDNRSNRSGAWDKVKDSVRRAWNRV